MAYYTTLINAWNNATQPPPGVIGTALTAGMTTAQKLTAVNGWKVSSPQKVLLTPSQIINAIVPADLAVLTSLQVEILTLVLQGSVVDGSAGTTVRTAIQTIFAGKTQTLANLGALVSPFDNATEDWCFANNYPTFGPQGPGNLSTPDTTNAGIN